MDKINKLPEGYNYRPLPFGFYIGFSEIEGNGLFTKLQLDPGYIIGISHKECEDKLIRLPLGGFINHSDNPNCRIIKSSYDCSEYILETIKGIDNEEITVDYYKSDCGLNKICKN